MLIAKITVSAIITFEVESWTHVPGLSGLKHDVDKPPQPLFKPGHWESKVGYVEDKDTRCTESCCCRTYLPTEVT